jgi:hypothetical protein
MCQVFARAPEVVSEIVELLYPYLSLWTLSPSSYMLCSCFVLSFVGCIVTVIWSLFFCCYCFVGYLSDLEDYSSSS